MHKIVQATFNHQTWKCHVEKRLVWYFVQVKSGRYKLRMIAQTFLAWVMEKVS